MNNAILIIYILLAVSAISFVAGCFILAGIGFALIALTLVTAFFAFLLSRGLTND